MAERWTPVVGYGVEIAARYEISDHGRVRSRDRWISRGSKGFTVKGRVLRPQVKSWGYERIRRQFKDTGVSVTIPLHTAVLLAFVGGRPPDAVVRHIDGNPRNNHLSNLCWDSQTENSLDRRRHGTDYNAAKTNCPAGHPYDMDNTYVHVARNGFATRSCRACNRAAVARYKARKTEVRAAR